MARQRLNYKLYPVSTRVDPRGVYYGLIQGTTTEPLTSLREILAYKKITAFDPAQVLRLTEDILQGALELTALDGRPRAVSSLIKTFLGFDKSFPTADARVTDQKLVARVRLLKDLRLPVNMDDFTLVNESGPTTVLDKIQIWNPAVIDDPGAQDYVSAAVLNLGLQEQDPTPIRLNLTGIGMDVPNKLELAVLENEAMQALAFPANVGHSNYYNWTAAAPYYQVFDLNELGTCHEGDSLRVRLYGIVDQHDAVLAERVIRLNA